MRRGQHAADDGSFGRSAGGAMARGIALIVVAVALGVLLLNATDSPEPFAGQPVDSTADTTPDGTTDSTAATGETTTTTTAQAPRDPATVTVLVANGAGIQGLAGRITDQLEAQNYLTANATDTLAPADESMVFYTPGYEADAAAIAALLTPPPATAPLPDPPPVADMAGANVLIVAAADLATAAG
jgi:hypothetical protein